MTQEIVTIPVSGMTCTNCAMNIERGVKKLPGIQSANVNFASEQATVSFNPRDVSVENIIESIHGSGFSVPTAKTEFPVRGMTCANCAMNIERILSKKVPGVVAASVNFASERASVEYVPAVTSMEEMAQRIEQAGFEAIFTTGETSYEDVEKKARDAEIKDQTRKYVIGVVFAVPLFFLSMAPERITSADSMAMSVPVPMAIPTSA